MSAYIGCKQRVHRFTIVMKFLCLSVDSSLLSHIRVALIFEGLDTVAEVAIGSEVVGNSDNMFVRYIFDVKDQLQVRQLIYSQKLLYSGCRSILQ